jgi:hypothetical protein
MTLNLATDRKLLGPGGNDEHSLVFV